jgi:hypothetical protein
MTRARKIRATPFARMTTDELQAATAEFEREMVAEEFGPLSPSARSRWKKARRKPYSLVVTRKAEEILSVDAAPRR